MLLAALRRRRGITASKNALHASRLPVILLSWCSALTAVRRDGDGARALPSSPGPGVMLSTFCSELTGLLCLNEAELAARRAVEGQGAKAHAHLLLHYQKKADGYFTSELFQTHVRDVIGVMKWKECLKGKEIWLVFDNSRVHDAMCRAVCATHAAQRRQQRRSRRGLTRTARCTLKSSPSRTAGRR